MAIAGLALSGAWVLGIAGLIAVAIAGADRDSSGQITSGGSVSVRRLAPGEQAVFAQAEQGCLDRLRPYSAAAADDESLDVIYLHPTETSWRRPLQHRLRWSSR